MHADIAALLVFLIEYELNIFKMDALLFNQRLNWMEVICSR